MKLCNFLDLIPNGTMVDVLYGSGDCLFRIGRFFPEKILPILNKEVCSVSAFSTSSFVAIFIVVEGV